MFMLIIAGTLNINLYPVFTEFKTGLCEIVPTHCLCAGTISLMTKAYTVQFISQVSSWTSVCRDFPAMYICKF